jgi:hypothetical protein
MCAVLLLPLSDASAQWIGRMWGSWPSIDFIVDISAPGGRATGTTNPDVGNRVANVMDGYFQMAIEDFNVPSYFEPFQNDQPELLGKPFNKFVNDYMQDARDFTRTHFEYGDGISPKIYRNQPPSVSQDGVSLAQSNWTIFGDRGDQVVSDLTADLMLPLEVAYAGGLTERRKLYAWQSPEQDDMFILIRSYGRPDPPNVPDARAGNRGSAPSPESNTANPVFDDLYIGQNFMLVGGNGQGPMAQVGQGQGAFGPTHLGSANLGALGRWDELYFYDDDAKMVWARDGDSGISSGYRSDGDDRGEPAPPEGNEALELAKNARISAGEFLESEYKGKLWLYVSQTPTTLGDFSDANNWLLNESNASETAQPRLIKRVTNDNWQNTSSNTRSNVYDWIVEPGTTRAGRIMESDDPSTQQTELLPYALQVTWGPWDLKPGEWIHTVEAWVVAGPHADENKRVGAQWASGQISFAEKEAFLNSGQDSLAKAADLARQAWADRRVVNGTVNGSSVSWPIGVSPSLPLGPAWPSNVTYKSGPAQNEIEWTGASDAAGYNVYKMTGHETNLADPPIPINGNSLVTGTNYIDTDVIRGERYFYAVTSVDADGQESSIFATRSLSDGVSPFSAPTGDLKKVRIVPNPYSVLGGDLSSGGSNFTGQPNKLLFVNLPSRAIIRIFTLQGDLVTRLDHISGSGDEEWELMANDNNQFVVSGVYVAHITNPDTGETDIEKFVVIR